MVRRILLLISAALSLILFVSSTAIAQSASAGDPLTLEQFQDKLTRAVNPQILDVRSPQEFAENHLKGAVNFYVPDDETFEHALLSLSKDRPVFVYSINNGRSRTVAARLIAAGFNEVYALPGGLAHWIGAGNPIETAASTAAGLTRAEFDKLIPGREVVLVEIGSKHCGSCRKLAPVVDEISHEQGVRVINIELYENRELARDLNVEAVPTVLLFKGKELIWRKSGAISKYEIVDALDSSL